MSHHKLTVMKYEVVLVVVVRVVVANKEEVMANDLGMLDFVHIILITILKAL